MKQLSVRGFDPELAETLRTMAEENGISLSQAAIRLMKKGAGLGEGGRERIGSALDRFIGTMDDKEVAEFESSIRPCEEIDEEFWR